MIGRTTIDQEGLAGLFCRERTTSRNRCHISGRRSKRLEAGSNILRPLPKPVARFVAEYRDQDNGPG